MRNGLAEPIDRYEDELLDINEYFLAVLVANLAGDRYGCSAEILHAQAEFNDVILNGSGNEIYFRNVSRNEVRCSKLTLREYVRLFINPAQQCSAEQSIDAIEVFGSHHATSVELYSVLHPECPIGKAV